jgi:hypothetical protein
LLEHLFHIGKAELAGAMLPQRNWRSAISSRLMAFGSAWKARMSSTKRRATAGRQFYRLEGHGLDIGNQCLIATLRKKHK